MARILLVEDERIIAVDIRARLESAGHTVCAIAADADTAYLEVERHRPDIALMDIRIRGAVDGIDAATRFRNEFGTPVIFLTASADPDNFARAKQARPHGYILKPFQDHAVEIAIEMALERIRLEHDLAEQRDLMSAVVDHMDSYVISVDADDRVRYANIPALALLGGETAVFGHRLDEVLHLESIQQADDGSRRATMRTASGGETPVELFERSYENRGGRVVVLTEVQNRIDYEQALIQARQQAQSLYTERAEFLGNIRHELRTPLNSILGMTALLKESGQDGNQQEYLDILSGATQRLSALIQSVLDFSRIEFQLKEGEECETTARALCDPLIEAVRPDLERKGLSLELVEEHGCPESFVVNVPVLQQIVSHILTNAVTFTDTGRVRVCCGIDRNGSLTIRVSDTGPGIAEEDRQRVFEPFVQLDYALNRDHGGLGLGLPMAARLADMLGGSVRIAANTVADTNTVADAHTGESLAVVVSVPARPAEGTGFSEGAVVRAVSGSPREPAHTRNTGLPLRVEVIGQNGRSSELVAELRAAGYLSCLADRFDCDVVVRAQSSDPRTPPGVLPLIVLVDAAEVGHAVEGDGIVQVCSEAELLRVLQSYETKAGEEAFSRACGRELSFMLPDFSAIERRAGELRDMFPEEFGTLRRALFRIVLASRRMDVESVGGLARDLCRAGMEGVQ